MLEEAELKQKEKERREDLERERVREEQLAKDDPNHKKEQDEWQEEEEVHVDLSDLNIKELPQEEERGGAGQTLDADGNPTTAQAVWTRKKDKGARNSTVEPEPKPVKPAAPVAAAPEPAKPAGSGYVPPHMRNRPAGAESSDSSGGPLQPVRLGGARSWHSKKAPDIASDQAFPTLGSAVEETARGAWGQRGGGRAGGQEFQRVRHGNTSSQDGRGYAPKLSLGNKFDALQSNDC